jgi:hypothetical protein
MTPSLFLSFAPVLSLRASRTLTANTFLLPVRGGVIGDRWAIAPPTQIRGIKSQKKLLKAGLQPLADAPAIRSAGGCHCLLRFSAKHSAATAPRIEPPFENSCRSGEAQRPGSSAAKALRTSDWDRPNCLAIREGLIPALKAAHTAFS